MKTQFQHLSRSVSTLQGVGGREHAKAWTPYPGTARSQGVALVITLILLSVITFMTVTFLVISRHEGEQVDTTTQQTVAKFAAEGILQQAEGQIAAGIMASRNGYSNALIVSTGFVSPFYDPTATVRTNLNNVNYNYANGGALNQADQLQMLNNLLYLPRAPVFITNKVFVNNALVPTNEFRFYLDENGNGKFDTNGLVNNLDINGITNGTTSIQVGDPEWIGFLEHSDQRHSPSNFFLSRGAFIALPIGNSLDINYIHNQAKLNPTNVDGFLRNQGVGSWEINLAAFLHTLNTNFDSDTAPYVAPTFSGSPYQYLTTAGVPSQGTSFSDAASILNYRYNGGYTLLNNFTALYPPNAITQISPGFLFGNYYIDGYAQGPLMYGVGPLLVPLGFTQPIGSFWSGADNPIQIVRPRDLLTAIPALNSGAPQNSFTNHLYTFGTGLDTYDQYTFYRLLAQMGVGSAPEPAPYPVGGTITGISGVQIITTNPVNPVPGRNQMSFGTVPEPYPYVHGRKMNLNYNNIGSNSLTQTIALTATNFTPWTPVEFFTNAADRLLRTYYPTNFALVVNGNNGTPFVTNLNINFVPVYPVNYYTPAVHRLLQLAANMYDASTNKYGGTSTFDYPSVFRPYFGVMGTGPNSIVYITGYTEQLAPGVSIGAKDPFWGAPLDLRRGNDLRTFLANFQSGPNGAMTNGINNLYGVPYVIGARTNLPNFNQLSMASVVQISRPMQLNRINGRIITNVAYTIGISNVVGVQCWNSHTNILNLNNFPLGVRIYAADDFSMFVSNTFNGVPTNVPMIFGLQSPYTTYPVTLWTNGVNATNGSINLNSFSVIPLMSNAVALSNNYSLLQNGNYSQIGTVFFPLASNRITGSFLPDWAINVTNRLRVIMQDPNSGRILDYVQLGGLGQLAGPDSQDTVLTNLSAISGPPNYNFWDTNTVSATNLLPRGIYNQLTISTVLPIATSLQPYWINAPGGSSIQSISQAVSNFDAWLVNSNANYPIQVPFSMNVNYAKYYTWSANDPLVHYTVGDLTDSTKTGANAGNNRAQAILTTNAMNNILTNLNAASPRYMPWNTVNSSYGQITGNNQIAYRDPMVINASAMPFPANKYPNVGWVGRVHRGTPWQTVYLKSTNGLNLTQWQAWTGNPDPVDAANTMPQNDFQMLDLFTTAPNDNASRGQLSINQTNAAAWAAVLDGVMVLANNITPGTLVSLPLDTTTNGGPGQTIITNINVQQAAGAFSSVGQILSVPQLTTASPYITMNPNDTNLTDAVYERIPQQIMGLLRVGTPRYAIYAYGQSLKPAPNSIVQSGQFFGMCTNYQITGEVLTRAIVRFDNMPTLGSVYPPPGRSYAYALPLQNATTPEYIWVTNTMPPMRTVVESYQVLSPDQ